MIAYVFDTETTDLIENGTLPLDKQPEIIEFFGQSVDLTSGEVLYETHHLIKPSKPISDTTTKITHIRQDMLTEAPAFKEVAESISQSILNGGRPIAHNASFDKEMLEIEFARLGQTIAWPKRPLCTVEATIHLKGHRLNLTALHELLFCEPFPEAHRAKFDVMALTRCAIELYRRGEL